MSAAPSVASSAGEQAHGEELGALAAGHLGARGAVDAHHRGFAAPLVLGGDQRRVQHQQAGAEREQEDELHRADHLVDHRLALAQRGADVDHRQVGKSRRQLVHRRLRAGLEAEGADVAGRDSRTAASAAR